MGVLLWAKTPSHILSSNPPLFVYPLLLWLSLLLFFSCHSLFSSMIALKCPPSLLSHSFIILTPLLTHSGLSSHYSNFIHFFFLLPLFLFIAGLYWIVAYTGWNGALTQFHTHITQFVFAVMLMGAEHGEIIDKRWAKISSMDIKEEQHLENPHKIKTTMVKIKPLWMLCFFSVFIFRQHGSELSTSVISGKIIYSAFLSACSGRE